MTYRVSLNSIVENLERYCKHVDSLCTCYKAEQKKLEKDLQKMQGTYTDGYIQQTKKNWKPDIDYAAEMQKKREQTKTIVQFHLKSIKKEDGLLLWRDFEYGNRKQIDYCKSYGY